MGIVNWDVALDTAGGDSALLDDVIEAFLEERERMLRHIQESAASRQAEELQRAAHTLKSSLRIFGCREACETAYQLEQLGEVGAFEQAEPLIAQLCLRTEEAARELKSGAGRPNAS